MGIELNFSKLGMELQVCFDRIYAEVYSIWRVKPLSYISSMISRYFRITSLRRPVARAMNSRSEFCSKRYALDGNP